MKPRTLRGITSLVAQSEISRRRFPEIDFVWADAVKYVTSLPSEQVDRIFAVDCVYHFSSRTRFLDGCVRALRNNGRIALTDLVLGDNVTFVQKLLLRVVCFLTGVSYSNFKVRNEYFNDFFLTGFEDITIEDISAHVFPGLQNFIYRHRIEIATYGIGGNWFGYLMFARILKWWWTARVVRFIVVHARKSSNTSATIASGI